MEHQQPITDRNAASTSFLLASKEKRFILKGKRPSLLCSHWLLPFQNKCARMIIMSPGGVSPAVECVCVCLCVCVSILPSETTESQKCHIDVVKSC